jgi:uncharacterized protein YdeI (YjbR/CyaY-like superfamily)
MGKRNPQVDAYIEKAAPFAKPILKKLRTLFHKASPLLEEKIKWGVPSFEYKGLVGGFSAHKQHVNWLFWKAQLLKDPKKTMGITDKGAMGGAKVMSVDDLPGDEVFIDLVRQAVELNAQGAKLPPRPRTTRPQIKSPKPFILALSTEPKAKAFFETLAPSCRREYLEWITEAKRDETRDKRIAQAVEWLAEGKKRNWKYE